MTKLFRKPNRLQNYNYSLPGYYFITICTHNRKELFGKIQNGKMILNNGGKIVDKHIQIIMNVKQGITIDKYVIMPNHIHLILINETHENNNDRTKMMVSKIIQQFKSNVTKDIRSAQTKKVIVWQKSFYDRIIRNEKELFLIRKYIEDNPLKWELDKSIPENLYM